jgi:ubiquinone/menaquinone biosynthesis C-methylase UbiE
MDWHARYLQQARWTAQLRSYLLGRTGLQSAAHVLELGCGTGALLADFPFQHGLHGLDLNFAALTQAARHAPGARLVCGDASCLPLPPAAFDLVFCHFLLLWVKDPLQVLSEMRRVTRPGGVVLAFAEPDYGGRIDYPFELAELGRWQVDSLRTQGADPLIGRQLAALFQQAGLAQVESGVLGGEWKAAAASSVEHELEWQVLRADLARQIPAADLQKMQRLDAAARQAGARILYVPTFYAWGIA